MQNLSRLERFLVGAAIALGGMWLILSVLAELIVFRDGADSTTTLLRNIASLFGAGALGVAFLFAAIRRQQGDAGPAGVGVPRSPTGYLRNLAIWIVVAVLLVFLFNAFQGTDGGRRQISAAASASSNASDPTNIFIQVLPVLLMFGVWIFIMLRMRAKNKDKDPT